MSAYQYIPIDQSGQGRSYVFHVELEQQADGRWSAGAKELPGCVAWGYSRGEALEALRCVAQGYIRMHLERSGNVPGDLPMIRGPVVAVTV